MAMMLLAPMSSAFAQDASCDAKVVDQAGVLDINAVNSAVRNLELATGADVRVRAFRQLPQGVDSYEAAQVTRCDSWHVAGTQAKKANLIVLAFSFEPRQSLLNYGSSFHALDGQVNSIRNNTMGDRFREGNFTAGVVNALNAMSNANRQPQPTATSSGPDINWSIVALVAGIIVSVIVVGLFVFLGVPRMAENSRRQRDELSEARRHLERSRSIASGLYETLAGFDTRTMRAEVELAGVDLNPTDLEKLRKRLESFDTEVAQADTALRELDGSDDAKLAKSRDPFAIHAVANRYDVLVSEIKQATEAGNKLRAAIKLVSEQIAQAPKDLAALQALHDTAVSLVNQLKETGYRLSTIVDNLDNVGINLDTCERHISTGHPGQAIVLLQQATADCKQYIERLQAIQAHPQDLLDRHAALSAQLQTSEVAYNQARQTLARLREQFMEPVLGTAAAIVAAAGQARNSAAAELAKVPGFATMETQQWDQAITALREAEKLVVEATASFGVKVEKGDKQSSKPPVFTAEVTRIEALPQTTAARLQSVQSSINSARTTIAGLRGDHSSRLADLRRCESQVELGLVGASRHSSRMIDYASVNRDIDAVQSSVDSALSAARRAHQRIVDDEAARAAADRRRRDDEEAARRRSSSSYSSGYSGGFVGGSFDTGGSGSSGGSFDGGGGSSGSW